MISGKAVTLQAGEPGEIHVAKIGDVTAMQEALELRARAFCMLGLASYAVYRRLTEFFVARLRDLPPEGFRAPTLNEIRKCDRVLREDLLRFISKSVGTLDQGVSFHLDKPDHAIWKLVAHEVEGVPDKGLDPKSNIGPGGKPRKEDRKLSLRSQKEGGRWRSWWHSKGENVYDMWKEAWASMPNPRRMEKAAAWEFFWRPRLQARVIFDTKAKA